MQRLAFSAACVVFLIAGAARAQTSAPTGSLTRSPGQPAQPAPRTTPAPATKPAPAAKQDKKPRPRSIAEDTTIRLRAAGWVTSLAGTAAVGAPIPGSVSEFDLIDTLGLDPDRTVFLGGVGINFGKSLHLDAGYGGPFEFDGTSDPIDISFDGLRFTGVVTSQAQMDLFQVDLMADLIELGPVTVSFGPGARIFDFEATVSGTASDPNGGPSFQTTESVDIVAPIPGLALGLRVDLTKRLYARGAVRGMYLGDYGNYFDAAAELGFDITRNVGVFAGYRWLHAEADIEDVRFNVDLDGLFAGIEVRF